MQLSQCNALLTGQTSTNVTIVDNDCKNSVLLKFVCMHVFNVVITVQFSAEQYTATESSRMMIVGVTITGGSSSSVVMATVQPSQLSPVSATGNNIYNGSDYFLIYV